MAKPSEKHVDLNPEQWATVKAALDGEVTELRERAEEAERKLERAEQLIRCRVCGRITIDESMCYKCLDEDVAGIVKTHTMVEVSNAAGSWDMCQHCNDSWPCDALKALYAQSLAQSRLATAQEALRWHEAALLRAQLKWEDADVHPRHGPECKECIEFWDTTFGPDARALPEEEGSD